MAKSNTAIVSRPAFNAPVRKLAAAFANVGKAGVKLGDTVLEIAPTIPQDGIEVFCKMLQAKLDEQSPEMANSNKTQVTYVRRVLKAIIVDGVEVKPGQTLRGLYDSLPKTKTGGASHTRKINAGAEEKPAGREEKPSKARTISVEDAVRTIFGHTDDELMAAVEWARQNELSFVRYARANIAAAAAAEVVATAKSAAKRLRKAA